MSGGTHKPDPLIDTACVSTQTYSTCLSEVHQPTEHGLALKPWTTRGNPREFLTLHTRRDLDVNYQAETWKKRQRLHLTAKVGSCPWPTSNPDLKAPAMCSRLCHILGRQVFLFRNTTICLATETITEKDKGVRGQGRGAPRIPGADKCDGHLPWHDGCHVRCCSLPI